MDPKTAILLIDSLIANRSCNITVISKLHSPVWSKMILLTRSKYFLPFVEFLIKSEHLQAPKTFLQVFFYQIQTWISSTSFLINIWLAISFWWWWWPFRWLWWWRTRDGFTSNRKKATPDAENCLLSDRSHQIHFKFSNAVLEKHVHPLLCLPPFVGKHLDLHDRQTKVS